MSPDRVVFSFILGWALLLAVLIVLDWLGNPNRGPFRPKGDRRTPRRNDRRERRRRSRAEADASVRATLRDAYGASSLRLTWTRDRETAVRRADDSLVVNEESSDDVVDVASREVAATAQTAVIGDPLPNLDETSPEEPEPVPPPGWNVGGDPLALTRRGTRPTAATVRSRVWKNHATQGAWDPENLERLQAGRPPRRTNPVTGEEETARVDVATGTATWPDEPLDPFESGS